MKTIQVVAVILLLSCLDLAQDYKRPTADSGVMSGVYYGKSGAGPISPPNGSSIAPTHFDTSTHSYVGSYSQTVFSSWQSATGGYSALTLYTTQKCNITSAVGGSCQLDYSVDGGSTWANLYSYAGSNSGDTQSTISVVLSPTLNLANLQLRASAYVEDGSVGTTTLTLYDVWTLGITANSAPASYTVLAP